MANYGKGGGLVMHINLQIDGLFITIPHFIGCFKASLWVAKSFHLFNEKSACKSRLGGSGPEQTQSSSLYFGK